MTSAKHIGLAIAAVAATFVASAPAGAQSLSWNADPSYPFGRSPFQEVVREPVRAPQATVIEEDEDTGGVVQERFRRQMVNYATQEPAGTVIIDTGNTYLYYVLGNGRAIRYGIGVGRDGFRWAGTQTVSNKKEWPDWNPPAEMIARQPYLPRFMAGGPGNPLGARAMYLGNTQYRIHGTNAPSTIGQRVSSGCIRLTNEDVTDLFNRVQVGAKVVVLPDSGVRTATAKPVRQRVSTNETMQPMSIRPY